MFVFLLAIASLADLFEADLKDGAGVQRRLCLNIFFRASPSAVNGRTRGGQLAFSNDLEAGLFDSAGPADWKADFPMVLQTSSLEAIRTRQMPTFLQIYLFHVPYQSFLLSIDGLPIQGIQISVLLVAMLSRLVDQRQDLLFEILLEAMLWVGDAQLIEVALFLLAEGLVSEDLEGGFVDLGV